MKTLLSSSPPCAPSGANLRALPIRAGESVARLIDADSVTVGTIDDSILGFLISGQRSLVDGVDRVGVIRYIYTEPEARGVGLADEMFGYAVAKLRAGGVELFDAIVSPGHREAKNFL